MKGIVSGNKTLWALMTAILMAFSFQAQADMVSTGQLLADSQMQVQKAELQNFLARDEVASMLAERGVDVAAAQSRIDSLSASELSALQAQIDQLPAGEGVLEAALFLLVIFILLDLAGVTNIFPGI